MIEDRLRRFIESSVQLLPGSRHQLLANQLAGALRESLISHSERFTAPNIYTISLNPENISFWENRQELFEALAFILVESAHEVGLRFQQDPVIRLAGDPSLAVDEFRLITSEAGASGSTNALTIDERRTEYDSHKPNAYLILDGYRTFPLHQRVVNIGRRLGNHIVIDDPRVSRSHAQVRTVRGRYVLFDLNSTGGTFINGLRITQHSLKPGDVISLAGYTLIYGEDTPPVEDGDTRVFSSNGA
jgi:hypothetical protein